MPSDDASCVLSSYGVAPRNAPPSDWRILRDAILKSLTTSPGAFLANADELAAEPPEYWRNRLRSSTWAVVQRRNEVLGIAAVNPPGEVDFYASPENACFIESVWIDPSMRGNGVGQRLVTYLMEQRRRDAGIQKFYLWVFDYNARAIRLYQHMGFKPTGQPSELVDRVEIQFLRAFDSHLIDDDELNQNTDARERDRKDFGITYRLLTSKPAWTRLVRLAQLRGWYAAGSISRNMPSALRKPWRGRSAR